MRLNPATRFLAPFAIAALLGAVVAWLALRPHLRADSNHKEPSLEAVPDPGLKVTEADLRACIGLTGKAVVEKLALKGAEWSWVDEPPGILRGVSYSAANGRQVMVYLAEGEPLFRRFNERREWDYKRFLAGRVGGIQYQAGGLVLDIGSAVPWQWRR